MKHFFTLLFLLLVIDVFGQQQLHVRISKDGINFYPTMLPILACEGSTVTLTDSSYLTGGGSIVNRSWSFSGGCAEVISQTSHSITVRFNCRTIEDCPEYPECYGGSTGRHSVNYTYDNGRGSGINMSDGITITPPLNIRRIAGNMANDIDLKVTGGQAPYTFLWNDGATTEDRFNLPDGNYCVTVTDRSGCTASEKCFKAKIMHFVPRALFLASKDNNWLQHPQICQGDSLVFEDRSSPDATIISRRWEFVLDSVGNRRIITGNQKRVVIQYNAIGRFPANLTVTDSLGIENTYQFGYVRQQMGPVTVHPKAPVVISRVVQECQNGENQLRVEMPPPPPNKYYNYRWDNGYTTSSRDGISNNSPVASGNVAPGTYCVSIYTFPEECSRKDTCILVRDRCNQLRNCSTPILQLPHITTPVSGLIQWLPMRDVLRYQISWRPFGSNTWQNINVINPNVSSFLIQNLNRNTTYQFRIRAWCINAMGYTNHALGTFTTGN